MRRIPEDPGLDFCRVMIFVKPIKIKRAKNQAPRTSEGSVCKFPRVSWRPERSGVEPPFVFSSRNKRWLDFARHDSLI